MHHPINAGKITGTETVPGLVAILADVRDRRVSVEEAAEEIRQRALISRMTSSPLMMFQFGGAVFAAIGVVISCYSLSFAFGTVDAPGTVVRIDDGLPVVSYNVNGNPREYRSLFSLTPTPYKVGDQVRVLYRVREPWSAQINTFTDRWLLPTAFIGGGILLILFGTLATHLMVFMIRQVTSGRGRNAGGF